MANCTSGKVGDLKKRFEQTEAQNFTSIVVVQRSKSTATLGNTKELTGLRKAEPVLSRVNKLQQSINAQTITTEQSNGSNFHETVTSYQSTLVHRLPNSVDGNDLTSQYSSKTNAQYRKFSVPVESNTSHWQVPTSRPVELDSPQKSLITPHDGHTESPQGEQSTQNVEMQGKRQVAEADGDRKVEESAPEETSRPESKVDKLASPIRLRDRKIAVPLHKDDARPTLQQIRESRALELEPTEERKPGQESVENEQQVNAPANLPVLIEPQVSKPMQRTQFYYRKLSVPVLSSTSETPESQPKETARSKLSISSSPPSNSLESQTSLPKPQPNRNHQQDAALSRSDKQQIQRFPSGKHDLKHEDGHGTSELPDEFDRTSPASPGRLQHAESELCLVTSEKSLDEVDGSSNTSQADCSFWQFRKMSVPLKKAIIARPEIKKQLREEVSPANQTVESRPMELSTSESSGRIVTESERGESVILSRRATLVASFSAPKIAENVHSTTRPSSIEQPDQTSQRKLNLATTAMLKTTTTKKLQKARSAIEIKAHLLRFCVLNTAEYRNVKIENFSTSFSDGLAFCALIHHFFPDAFDFSVLDSSNPARNMKIAFDTAESKGGVAQLLEIDDMIKIYPPDWKSVFTYVQLIYYKLRSHQRNKFTENSS